MRPCKSQNQWQGLSNFSHSKKEIVIKISTESTACLARYIDQQATIVPEDRFWGNHLILGSDDLQLKTIMLLKLRFHTVTISADCTAILAAEAQHRNKIRMKQMMRSDKPTCVTRGSRSLSTVSVRISRLLGSHFNRIGEVAVLMVSAAKQTTTGKHEKSDNTVTLLLSCVSISSPTLHFLRGQCW